MTYDKEIYAKLKSWFDTARADVIAKAPLITAYKDTGKLDDGLLPIINGLSHEADNGNNGGVITPVGSSDENVSVPQERHSGVVVGDVFERVLGNGVLERRIVESTFKDSYYFVEDEDDGREMIGEYAWTLQRFKLVKPSPLRTKEDGNPLEDSGQTEHQTGDVPTSVQMASGAVQEIPDGQSEEASKGGVDAGGNSLREDASGDEDEYDVSEEVEGKEDAGSDNEPDTGDVDNSFIGAMGVGPAETTQADAGLLGQTEEAEQDSSSQTPQDIAASLGAQGQKFAVGDVVEAKGGTRFTFEEADRRGLCKLHHSTGNVVHLWPEDLTLIHHTDVPCPGDGWLRNTGVIPDGEVEAVCFDNGIISCFDGFYLGFDREQDNGYLVAWYKPKEAADHASDCATHNEPAMEAGECDCDETNERTVATNGPSDGQERTSSGSGETLLSQTENTQPDTADSQGNDHPLAEWIMQQEWAQDGYPENIIPNLRIVGDFIHYSYHDNVTPEDLIDHFLIHHTPKGWERFDHPYPETSGEYEIILATGERGIVDDVFVNSTTGILFVREHIPESKDNEQDAEQMGPNNFQSKEYVGNGLFIPLDKFESMTDDEQDAELETGEVAQEIEMEPEEDSGAGSVRTAATVGVSNDVSEEHSGRCGSNPDKTRRDTARMEQGDGISSFRDLGLVSGEEDERQKVSRLLDAMGAKEIQEIRKQMMKEDDWRSMNDLTLKELIEALNGEVQS